MASAFLHRKEKDNSSLTPGRRIGKAVLTILAVVLALILAAALCVLFVFRKELGSVWSLQKQDDFYYTMDYKADYGLDEFLETGAKTDSELAGFIVKKLMKGLPVQISLPNLGCSTFAAETPEGEKLFARNFDNKEASYALVHTDPEDGYESISMVNLSYIGFTDGSSLQDKALALAAPYIPLDGVNEAGLAIGVLQLYNEPTVQETGKTPITTTSAIRMVLDKAATVDEAMGLLEAVQQDKTEDGIFSGTLWSGVYNLEKRTLMLSCNRDYETVRCYGVDGEEIEK